MHKLALVLALLEDYVNGTITKMLIHKHHHFSIQSTPLLHLPLSQKPSLSRLFQWINIRGALNIEHLWLNVVVLGSGYETHSCAHISMINWNL